MLSQDTDTHVEELVELEVLGVEADRECGQLNDHSDVMTDFELRPKSTPSAQAVTPTPQGEHAGLGRF